MIIVPPNPIVGISEYPSAFLAGSIDMNTAVNWQSQVSAKLDREDRIILNPRRPSWDSSCEQRIDNPQFRAQVEWELQGQETCDVILMYFHADSKAPITLMELGLFACSGRLIVCCPQGYWRKGNVDTVCRHYEISQVETLEMLIDAGNTYLNLVQNDINRERGNEN